MIYLIHERCAERMPALSCRILQQLLLDHHEKRGPDRHRGIRMSVVERKVGLQPGIRTHSGPGPSNGSFGSADVGPGSPAPGEFPISDGDMPRFRSFRRTPQNPLPIPVHGCLPAEVPPLPGRLRRLFGVRRSGIGSSGRSGNVNVPLDPTGKIRTVNHLLELEDQPHCQRKARASTLLLPGRKGQPSPEPEVSSHG